MEEALEGWPSPATAWRRWRGAVGGWRRCVRGKKKDNKKGDHVNKPEVANRLVDRAARVVVVFVDHAGLNVVVGPTQSGHRAARLQS